MTGPALRIGLTGGIGSGKSTVANFWRTQGADVIDADAIARASTAAGGVAVPAIRAAFGPAALSPDGTLMDRAWMREQAFNNPAVKARLEALLHPLIRAECDRLASQATGPVVVFDIPLLVESGRWRWAVERVLVVDADPATQVARVMRRSGWTAEAVESVIAQQATREARRAAADAVICNEGQTMAELSICVSNLWRQWVGGEPSRPHPPSQ